MYSVKLGMGIINDGVCICYSFVYSVHSFFCQSNTLISLQMIHYLVDFARAQFLGCTYRPNDGHPEDIGGTN